MSHEGWVQAIVSGDFGLVIGEDQITLLGLLYSVSSRTRQDLSLYFCAFSKAHPGSARLSLSMDYNDICPPISVPPL